jgi:Domain of unknown function (DUF4276)
LRYLSLALHCEGPTDRRFLEPLIRRALLRLVASRCSTPVDIAEQFVDLAASSKELEHIASRIIATASAVDLVFVHADGGINPERARTERFEPVVEQVGEVGGEQPLTLVAVVPIRETEAWLLADPDGLRTAFGTTRSIDELGLPANAGDVEHVVDPKALLVEAYQRAIGPRRRRRISRGYQSFFALLGEQVALVRLEDVPAFRRFEADLIVALRRLMPYAFR